MGEKKEKKLYKLRTVTGETVYGYKPYPAKPSVLSRLKKRLAPAAKRGRKRVKKAVKKKVKRVVKKKRKRKRRKKR